MVITRILVQLGAEKDDALLVPGHTDPNKACTCQCPGKDPSRPIRRLPSQAITLILDSPPVTLISTPILPTLSSGRGP